MSGAFQSFVLFSEMRTGSNFLEANLNSFAGITCHGEAFNPHFIGSPNRETVLGMSREQRDANPALLLDRLRAAAGLAGFRYFHDHDPRVLPDILADTSCAKIVLTRDSVTSYVSWKIARSTGQWKLTNPDHRKTARVRFDPVEYSAFVAERRAFHEQVMRDLRISGQTAFCLTYEDLKSVDILNGLATFLGKSDRITKLDGTLLVQNPGPVQDKVVNFTEMQDYLAHRATDRLHDGHEEDVTQHAAVKSYVVAAKSPLLYLPIPGMSARGITAWLAALDGVDAGALTTGLSQNNLRRWKRAHRGHRSFTVVCHPVLRAHDFFCRNILYPSSDKYQSVRRTLIERHGAPLSCPDTTCDRDAHRAAFLAFLAFLDANLRGRTALPVHPLWCTQSHAIQGFSRFAAPDVILRAEEMAAGLSDLARQIGKHAPPWRERTCTTSPFTMDDIYDEAIETQVARAYRRDYTDLGFGPWR